MINHGIFQAVLTNSLAEDNFVVVQPHQRSANLPRTSTASRVGQLRMPALCLRIKRTKSRCACLHLAQLVADQTERLVIALDSTKCFKVCRVLRVAHPLKRRWRHALPMLLALSLDHRSEERRVGKECRSR